MKQCYDCQYKERQNEMGPNKEEYDSWLMGNTISMGRCDTCHETTGILPKGDMDRAIRASQNKQIHPLEWD